LLRWCRVTNKPGLGASDSAIGNATYTQGGFGTSHAEDSAQRTARAAVACNPMVARDITLPVDPDEAWDALTDPELLEQWFGDGDREAVVEEAEPGERLVFWWWEDGEPGSRVELRLVAVPSGTRVSVREAPVGPFALAAA
jgi:hypothetical protein